MLDMMLIERSVAPRVSNRLLVHAAISVVSIMTPECDTASTSIRDNEAPPRRFEQHSVVHAFQQPFAGCNSEYTDVCPAVRMAA
jgi:hypothetical protein